MNKVYLGLGSNLGDRKGNILKAIQELESLGVTVKKRSSIIETSPVGGPPQGDFLNAVILAETEIPPNDFLKNIKNIEKKLGRVPAVKDGPRIIDIDILLYSDVKLSSSQLTIPHPEMLTRDFVMRPLLEIEPLLCDKLKNENREPDKDSKKSIG